MARAEAVFIFTDSHSWGRIENRSMAVRIPTPIGASLPTGRQKIGLQSRQSSLLNDFATPAVCGTLVYSRDDLHFVSVCFGCCSYVSAAPCHNGLHGTRAMVLMISK